MKIAGGIDIAATGNKTIYLELGWNSIKKSSGKNDTKNTRALSSKNLTFRVFDLPFGDKKKCKGIVQEELSYSLAFPLEQASWDFMLSSGGSALAVVSLNKNIPADLPANDVLDCDVSALARCAAYCNYRNPLIIDLGASKTLFCGLNSGIPNFVAVVPSGGDALTAAVAQAKNISPKEAELLKKEKGIELVEVRQKLLNIIKKAQIQVSDWEQIIICGGGAEMKGLSELLSDGLKIPVKTFEFPEGISPFYDAVAFGAALREKYPLISINLSGEEKQSLEIPVYWIVAVIVPLILLPVHLYIKAYTLDTKLKDYSNAVTTAIKKEFPDIGEIKSPKSQLQAKIDQRKLNQRTSSANIIVELDNISQALAGKPVTLYDMDFSKELIVLSGEAPSYNDVDTIRTKLLETFSDVRLEIKTLPSKKITFTLQIKTGEKKSNVVKV